MTKGTPASSQIVFLEQRVAVLEDDNERMRAALEEVKALVFGANHSETRYPLARAAMEGK